MSALDLQTVANQVDMARARNCTIYAMAALLAFEWMITINQEYQQLWTRRKTLVFWLFIGLRYGAMVSAGLWALWIAVPFSTTLGCSIVIYTSQAFRILSYYCMIVMFVLRTYAICNRSRAVLVYLVLLGSAKATFDFLASVRKAEVIDDAFFREYGSCALSHAIAMGDADTIDCILTALFDSSVFVITLVKTARQAYHARMSRAWPGYSYFMIRDGVFYFLAFVIPVIALVPLSLIPSQRLAMVVLGTTMSSFVSVIVARLILNLRQAKSAHESHSSTPTGVSTSLEFVSGRVIGNIAAPIHDPSDDAFELCRTNRIEVQVRVSVHGSSDSLVDDN